MDKILELLKLFEKFGVKPGKIIGAGDRKVVPIKKPILSKPLNRSYLLEDVEGGKIGINTVKNEIEDIAPLVFQKQLNDVEINNAISNLNYLDRLLNPTNIVDITTKQPVKGLESLRPTIAGELKTAGKQLEQKGKELEEVAKPDINAMLEDFVKAQRAMQLAEKSGYVRATARQIMREDILSKKLKLPKEIENEILQGLGEPIDVFRKVYGEDALERLDGLAPMLGQFRTEVDAAKIARKEFDFQPKKIELPETTTIEEAKKAEQEYGLNPKTAEVVDIPERSLMDKIKDIFIKRKKPAEVTDITAKINRGKNIDDLIEEYNKNSERMGLVDEEGGTLISYSEFQDLSKKNKEIEKILESLNVKSAKQIDEIEEVKPEGIVIPFKKKITEPEEKAEGGIIRAKFAKGGRGKKILDIINEVNKKLKGKKSMETVNPKTGEVTVPEKPVGTVMESEPVVRKYNQDIIKAADEIYPSYDDPKIAADQIVDSYAQMKYGLEDQYGLSNKERMDLYTQAYDYVMDYNRGAVGKTAGKSINISDEKTAKAFTDFARENDPEGFAKVSKVVDRLNELSDLRGGQEIFETYDLETYNYLTSEQISKLLNQLKNPYKILDEEKDLVKMGFTDKNFEGVGLKNFDEINFRADKKQLETYLKDLYNKKQVEEAQTELFNLQDSGREPNANGGLNYLMGF